MGFMTLGWVLGSIPNTYPKTHFFLGFLCLTMGIRRVKVIIVELKDKVYFKAKFDFFTSRLLLCLSASPSLNFEIIFYGLEAFLIHSLI